MINKGGPRNEKKDCYAGRRRRLEHIIGLFLADTRTKKLSYRDLPTKKRRFVDIVQEKGKTYAQKAKKDENKSCRCCRPEMKIAAESRVTLLGQR